jgi:uncharacterized protein
MNHILPHYVTQVLDHPSQLDPQAYAQLLRQQAHASPFLSRVYFDALETSGSATPQTGWAFRCVTLWQGNELVAACPGYIKNHSAGEYIFDHAWAQAYANHRLPYYPKFTGAPAFTPVPGNRLLARDAPSRQALLAALEKWALAEDLSSIHLLFSADNETALALQAGWLLRRNVQFHWENRQPNKYLDFDDFLRCLSHDKRKKIRQEQRKVVEAGVHFKAARGAAITPADWAFFYTCYEQTYYEHGRPPYLTPEFFERMARAMPENWLMFTAMRGSTPIASSLIGLNDEGTRAYGRYWGAIERVDCLHFDACYYQPLAWCIANHFDRFEGGAQGEHKMARALMPHPTNSLHWIAHPQFRDAIARFLEREAAGVQGYLEELNSRSPFKQKSDVA